MTDKNLALKKVSLSNTKQEMLDAYNLVLKQFQEKNGIELKLEETLEKKKNKETIETADTLSIEGVAKEIGDLRVEFSKLLAHLPEQLEDEIEKYKKLKEAVIIKEKELRQLYEIDRTAQTLAALIETQSQKRQEFEIEMAHGRKEINREMQILIEEREREKKSHEIKIKERNDEEQKLRQREKEEYEYSFKRQQQLMKDKLEDEKQKQEKEIQLKKEAIEKQLIERERQVKEKEAGLEELRRKIDNFPKEIESAINKAVKETTDRLQIETRNKEELLKKSFEGDRNALAAKAESLEKTNKEQKEQIIKLAQQLEKAYQQIEDIAVKTVGGFFDKTQQWKEEQGRKQSQEK